MRCTPATTSITHAGAAGLRRVAGPSVVTRRRSKLTRAFEPRESSDPRFGAALGGAAKHFTTNPSETTKSRRTPRDEETRSQPSRRICALGFAHDASLSDTSCGRVTKKRDARSDSRST
jgi:hypothetical protein